MVVLAQDSQILSKLRASLREVEDFPRDGIYTYDITSLLQDPELFRALIEELATLAQGIECDFVAGIYSRGYMIGAPLAVMLRKPFVPIPKSIDASPSAVRKAYDYEYAADELALDGDLSHKKVLLVDDQLATGGTMEAAVSLVEELGGEVAGCVFVLVQDKYDGLVRIENQEVRSLFRI